MNREKQTTRVFLDSISEGRARLVIGPEGRRLAHLPAELLPSGLDPGAALDLTLEVAPSDDTRAATEALMEELFAASETPT
jgi:hypothetical protein